MGCAAVWEIFEFTCDRILSTDAAAEFVNKMKSYSCRSFLRQE